MGADGTIPATLILISACLLARSAYHLMRTDIGVQPYHTFVCQAALSLDSDRLVFDGVDPKLPDAERSKKIKGNTAKFHERLVSDFTSIVQSLKNGPGVIDVGAISVAPYSSSPVLEMSAHYSRTPGHVPSANIIEHTIARSMTASAIPALGMRLLYGRNFDDESGSDQGSVIVNQALADELGGGPRAIGQYIQQIPGMPSDRIVGIVNNVHEQDLYSPTWPTVYYPFRENPLPDVDVVVRTSGRVPSKDIFNLIQVSVRAIAPDATTSHFAQLTDMVDSAGKWTNYSAYFLLALALLGVFLAGVCAWSKALSEVHRRRHEIGVRLALGASPGQIVGLMAGRELKLTVLATIAGAVLTWWSAHFMSYLFFEVKPSDLTSYVIGAGSITGYVLMVVIWSIGKAARRNPWNLVSRDPNE